MTGLWRRVQAILQNVQIEATEIHDAEVMDLLIDEVKLVVAVRRDDVFMQRPRPRQRPAIECDQFGGRHGVTGRVEAGKIAEQEPDRVAHAPVRVGHALQDLIGDTHVVGVVRGSDPESQHVGAERSDYLLWHHGVADGLRHLVALLVHCEAVRQHTAVGGVRVHRDRGQQRGVEPAAVLVAAFQVQVRRHPDLRPRARHAPVHQTGIDPHVHHVGRLLVRGRVGTEQLRRIEIEPGVDTTAVDPLRNCLDQLGRSRMQRAGLAVHEKRDRRTPDALPRNAPVRTILDHARDAVFTPARRPGDFLNFVERL